jgi:hypothetical protein
MLARRCICSESTAGALLQVEFSNLAIDTSMVQLRPIERPPSREIWNTNMAILASPFSHRYLASEPAPIVGTPMSARGKRCPEVWRAGSLPPIRAAPPRPSPIARASGHRSSSSAAFSLNFLMIGDAGTSRFAPNLEPSRDSKMKLSFGIALLGFCCPAVLAPRTAAIIVPFATVSWSRRSS